MPYITIVPQPIQEEISGLQLTPEVEESLYKELAEGLTDEELDSCMRLPAPSPTFILYVDLDDPDNLGLTHRFTFYLTFGPLDNALYPMQCFYQDVESWGDEPEDTLPESEHF